MPRPPSRRQRPAGRACACAVLAAVLAAVAFAPTARAGGATEPGTKLDALERAWQAQSADAIVACMEPKETAVFRLLADPFAGRARTMKPDQAKATLKEYFKGIGSVKLVDVTPKRSPRNVRLFDYTYRPAGANPRTTRLHVQLKQDPNQLWVLAAVTESLKPR